MVFFVSESLAQSKITNVLVESTNVFVTKELFVIVVVWKSQRKKYVVSVWDTSIWLFL